MPKFPAYAPFDNLIDLACRGGADIRPALLRALTELYVQKFTHTAEEEIQYVELALGLLTSADAATRKAVTARLLNYPNAPAALLNILARNEAASGPETPSRMVRSQTPAIERYGNRYDDLTDLFFSATPEERRLILTNLDVVTRLPRLPLAAHADLNNRLETAALQHNSGKFTKTIQHALRISGSLADRIVNDDFGEPLVVAARALRIQAPAVHRILLTLNPKIGQSITRVFALAQLFDEIPVHIAVHMIAIWQGSSERARPSHEPIFWNDEQNSARKSPPRHDSGGDSTIRLRRNLQDEAISASLRK